MRKILYDVGDLKLQFYIKRLPHENDYLCLSFKRDLRRQKDSCFDIIGYNIYFILSKKELNNIDNIYYLDRQINDSSLNHLNSLKG